MSSSNRIAWLPLRDGHAVPLHDLELTDPELAQLKTGARKVAANPEHEIQHNTVLNAVARHLGFHGGFAGMRGAVPEIRAFLREHGLVQPSNLVEAPANAFAFSVGRRAIADRVFHRRPKRIFTGYDYDWEAWEVQREAPVTLRGRSAPPGDQAAFLFQNRFELSGFWNLIGDGLVDPVAPSNVIDCTYAVRGHANPEAQSRRVELFALFRKFLNESDRGWLDVIPYNDHLAFLRGRSGAYDVVFRDLRDREPPERSEPRLHPDFCPSFLQGKHAVAAWAWFRRGWDERDRHDAELHYYARGGRPEEYPGQDILLREFWNTVEKPAKAPTTSIQPPAGFLRVRAGGKTLAVSELITIGELRFFLKATDYSAARLGDAWEPGNSDGDDQPAAVTWLDAAAYCAWFEKVTKQPVRLLTPEEYSAVLGKPDEGRPGVRATSVIWTEKWSGVIGQPAPARFVEALNWSISAGGVRRVDAWDFLEWRDNRTAASPYGWWPVGDDSWGAYKRCKIGFRLVLDGGAR